MRVSLTKKHNTKAERIFGEILKKNHISFRAKVQIKGREVDFLIGKIAVEIGNHDQNKLKNKFILESGYSILFLTNREIYDSPEKVEVLLLKWLI